MAESVALAKFSSGSATAMGTFWCPSIKDAPKDLRYRTGARWLLKPGAAAEAIELPKAVADVETWFFETKSVSFLSALVCHVEKANMPSRFTALRKLLASGYVLLLEAPDDFNLGAHGSAPEQVRALLAPFVASVGRDTPVAIICGTSDEVARWRKSFAKKPPIVKMVQRLVVEHCAIHLGCGWCLRGALQRCARYHGWRLRWCWGDLFDASAR